MSEEKTENTTESLGGYLLRQRTEQNITIDDLAADTRVPPKTIRAIEADDYSALPAEAFARGFYALIARRLGLDEKEILARFSKEQELPSASSSFSPPTTQESMSTLWRHDRPSPQGQRLACLLLFLSSS